LKTKVIRNVAIIVTSIMLLTFIAGCVPAANQPTSTTAAQGGATTAAPTEAEKPRLSKILYVYDTWSDKPKMVEAFNKFVSEQLGYEF